MTRRTNGAAEGEPSQDLSRSERYRLLASERRRDAISELAGASAPVELEDLAAHLANGDEAETRIELHHVHLPMMAEMGILEYDHERTRVTTHCDPRLRVNLQ